jgi:hypothetical protein
MHRILALALLTSATACSIDLGVDGLSLDDFDASIFLPPGKKPRPSPDGGDTYSDASADAEVDGEVAASPPEPCNGLDDDLDGKLDEGCPLLLARGALLDEGSTALSAGRVAWSTPDADARQLWTTRLPTVLPELVVRRVPPLRAAVDADRVVYSDQERFGYAVLDMRDRSERLVTPLDSRGSDLLTPSLQGDLLAYSQNLRDPCGTTWCDDAEVYLHDLGRNVTSVVGSHSATIQTAPRISGGLLVWLDDRHGHHLDQWSYAHWFDVMATWLPYDGSSLLRLTQAAPKSAQLIAFDEGRVLIDISSAPGLEAYQVLDIASRTALPIEWVVPQGSQALALTGDHLLVRLDPLGRCHLELVDLKQQRAVELDTQGECPTQAWMDGDYLVWPRTVGPSIDLYWMDIGDLK